MKDDYYFITICIELMQLNYFVIISTSINLMMQ